jgi:hypothetical protein
MDEMGGGTADSERRCGVTASREEGLRVAIVEDVPAVATDLDGFADLDEAVRDLIATCADLEAGDFDLERRFQHEEGDLAAR